MSDVRQASGLLIVAACAGALPADQRAQLAEDWKLGLLHADQHRASIAAAYAGLASAGTGIGPLLDAAVRGGITWDGIRQMLALALSGADRVEPGSVLSDFAEAARTSWHVGQALGDLAHFTKSAALHGDKHLVAAFPEVDKSEYPALSIPAGWLTMLCLALDEAADDAEDRAMVSYWCAVRESIPATLAEALFGDRRF